MRTISKPFIRPSVVLNWGRMQWGATSKRYCIATISDITALFRIDLNQVLPKLFSGAKIWLFFPMKNQNKVLTFWLWEYPSIRIWRSRPGIWKAGYFHWSGYKNWSVYGQTNWYTMKPKITVGLINFLKRLKDLQRDLSLLQLKVFPIYPSKFTSKTTRYYSL